MAAERAGTLRRERGVDARSADIRGGSAHRRRGSVRPRAVRGLAQRLRQHAPGLAAGGRAARRAGRVAVLAGLEATDPSTPVSLAPADVAASRTLGDRTYSTIHGALSSTYAEYFSDDNANGVEDAGEADPDLVLLARRSRCPRRRHRPIVEAAGVALHVPRVRRPDRRAGLCPGELRPIRRRCTTRRALDRTRRRPRHDQRLCRCTHAARPGRHPAADGHDRSSSAARGSGRSSASAGTTRASTRSCPSDEQDLFEVLVFDRASRHAIRVLVRDLPEFTGGRRPDRAPPSRGASRRRRQDRRPVRLRRARPDRLGSLRPRRGGGSRDGAADVRPGRLGRGRGRGDPRRLGRRLPDLPAVGPRPAACRRPASARANGSRSGSPGSCARRPVSSMSARRPGALIRFVLGRPVTTSHAVDAAARRTPPRPASRRAREAGDPDRRAPDRHDAHRRADRHPAGDRGRVR